MMPMHFEPMRDKRVAGISTDPEGIDLDVDLVDALGAVFKAAPDTADKCFVPLFLMGSV